MSVSHYLAPADRYLHFKYLVPNSDFGFLRCILISKRNKLHTLHIYSLLYVNHTPIKKFKRKTPQSIFSLTVSQKVAIRHLCANVEGKMGQKSVGRAEEFSYCPRKHTSRTLQLHSVFLALRCLFCYSVRKGNDIRACLIQLHY